MKPSQLRSGADVYDVFGRRLSPVWRATRIEMKAEWEALFASNDPRLFEKVD